MRGNQGYTSDPPGGERNGEHPGDRQQADESGDSTRSSIRSAEQRLLTSKAIHESGLDPSEVWLRYFSFSGMVAEYEVHAYLQGLIDLPRLQRDLIAQAVNELVDELPAPRRAPSDADLDIDG